jgi:hypothetical protein
MAAVKRYPEIGDGETKNDENRQCGSRRQTVVWRGAGLRQTVGWLLGSLATTFRPATCVDGAPALGLRQWCCTGVGSPAV